MMKKLILFTSLIIIPAFASAERLWLEGWPGFHGITAGPTFGKQYRSIEAGYVYGLIVNHYSPKLDHRLVVGPSVNVGYIFHAPGENGLFRLNTGGSLYYIIDSWGVHAGFHTSNVISGGNRHQLLLPEAGILHEGFLFGMIWSVNYRYCIDKANLDSQGMEGGYLNFSVVMPLRGGYGWAAL